MATLRSRRPGVGRTVPRFRFRVPGDRSARSCSTESIRGWRRRRRRPWARGPRRPRASRSHFAQRRSWLRASSGPPLAHACLCRFRAKGTAYSFCVSVPAASHLTAAFPVESGRADGLDRSLPPSSWAVWSSCPTPWSTRVRYASIVRAAAPFGSWVTRGLHRGEGARQPPPRRGEGCASTAVSRAGGGPALRNGVQNRENVASWSLISTRRARLISLSTTARAVRKGGRR